jgi:peptidoglycan-associated lipoprotein
MATKTTMTIRGTLALMAAILAAGCSTPVPLSTNKDVPVESRTGTAPGSGAGAGAGAGTGVPQTQVTTVSTGGASIPAGAQRTVYFDYDSFAIKDDYRGVIDSHAKVLVATRAKRMAVEGHTDERGGREYNLALGQKRAEAVTRALALLGVNEGQVEAVSFGKERPAASGSDEAAWAKNRRAEIKDK